MDIIEINYPNGNMELDAQYVIHDMPISDFKSVAKLLGTYDEPRKRWELIGICNVVIKDLQEEIDVLEKEKNTYQRKADGKEYTCFTNEFCNKLIRDVQKQINGLYTKINRYQCKIDILKSYMC